MTYAVTTRRVRPHSVHGLGCGCAMAGLGELTIEDRSIWSTSDVAAFYNRILDAISRLEQEISQYVPRNAQGDELRTELNGLKRFFLPNYSEYTNMTFPVGSSGTAVNLAREAAGRYNALERRYRTITGRSPRPASIGPVETVETPPTRVGGLPIWAWAGMGLVGLGLVGWISMSVSRSASSFSRAAIGTAMLANRRRVRRVRTSR